MPHVPDAWHSSFEAPDVLLRPNERAHVVQFYESDTYLVDLVSRFLGVGMAAGQPLLAVLTEPHRRAVCARLASVGFDVDEACAKGQLRLLDARSTLDKLMVDDMPHPDRVRSVIGSVMTEALLATPRRQARVFGEMVDVLWREGKTDAAIRLEELWNGLQKQHEFSLLCAYCLGNKYCESNPTHVRRICGAHSHTMTADVF